MSLTNKYSCIIVDDNEIDRITTTAFVKKYGFLHITGVYDNPVDALNNLAKTNPQILFLDIDMEDMSGLDLRKQLLNIPACIFITSYPDYALEGFEMAALDFIVKPLKADRFDISMKRLEDYLQTCAKSALLDHHFGADTIFIKDGTNQVKIHLHEIIYLEALKDYTRIVTASKKYAVLASLGNLLKEPSFKTFIRVHRSFAVQKHFIEKFTTKEIEVNKIKIPVGRSYKDTITALLL